MANIGRNTLLGGDKLLMLLLALLSWVRSETENATTA